MSGIRYVTLEAHHAPGIMALHRLVYPHTPAEHLFNEQELHDIAEIFPQGTFVGLEGEQVVAIASGLFVDFDWQNPQHTLDDIVEGARCYARHDPQAPYYYGTDISVHPAYRRRGIGKRLYELRKELVIAHNKRGIIGGGLLPGYAQHAHTLSPTAYIERVVAGDLYDPTLSFQLANGFVVRGCLRGYYPHPSSGGWASLLYWENTEYI
jgi:GNAT superfamily N-acetyltransferase